MTPVREALEKVDELIRRDPACFNLSDELQSVRANLRKALSAAPGEPCAPSLPKRPFAFAVKRAPENGEDQWRLFMDEAAARAEAEQLGGDYEGLYRVGDRRSALTPPQPAAGWDIEEIAQWLHDETGHPDSYPNHTWPETERDDGQRAGAFVKIVPLHAQEYFRDIARRLVTQLDRSALRREAPAPAEENVATVIYTNYRGDTAERRIIPRSVRYGSTKWHPEPQWLLVAYDCDKRAQREFALKDFGARPDTAEARLREALDLETIQTLLDLLNPLHGSLDEQTYDDKLRENFDAPADAEYGVNITARMERDLTQAVLILEDRKRQALSPSSGGDEAKESEGGGPNVHAINGPFASPSRTYVRQLVDDPNSSSGKSLQDVEVSPSEPSPPADRREIVAWPRVSDNDRDEITVTLDGKELRGWSYTNDQERRTKTLCAREFVEGFCTGRES